MIREGELIREKGSWADGSRGSSDGFEDGVRSYELRKLGGFWESGKVSNVFFFSDVGERESVVLLIFESSFVKFIVDFRFLKNRRRRVCFVESVGER